MRRFCIATACSRRRAGKEGISSIGIPHVPVAGTSVSHLPTTIHTRQHVCLFRENGKWTLHVHFKGLPPFSFPYQGNPDDENWVSKNFLPSATLRSRSCRRPSSNERVKNSHQDPLPCMRCSAHCFSELLEPLQALASRWISNVSLSHCSPLLSRFT